jgi:hypothetical protein
MPLEWVRLTCAMWSTEILAGNGSCNLRLYWKFCRNTVADDLWSSATVLRQNLQYNLNLEIQSFDSLVGPQTYPTIYAVDSPQLSGAGVLNPANYNNSAPLYHSFNLSQVTSLPNRSNLLRHPEHIPLTWEPIIASRRLTVMVALLKAEWWVIIHVRHLDGQNL